MAALIDFAQGEDFNPRSREGSDFAPVLVTLMSLVFQSTLP